MQIIKVMVLRRVMTAPRYQYPKAGSKSSHGRGYIGTQCSTAGGYPYIKVWDIKNNAWVTVNNDFFGHEWGDLPMIFTSDEVTSDNHWQITSRVTKKSLFTITNVLFYFLHAILYLEHTVPLKKTSIAHFAIVARDGLFWLNIVTSSQLICDVKRTRGTGIVTSYSSIVLARANWRKGDIH